MMISVTHLSKNFGSRQAISDLTFKVTKGEILGFLGPNGAGKTTTLRILAGSLLPTTGTASIGGFDILNQPIQARQIIGYLPEAVPLYPNMTPKEYLKYMGKLRKVKDLNSRISIVLNMVNLSERSNAMISQLPKGMRQRLGLAQALIHQPQVIILDEPTIGLDPEQIIEVRNLIQELRKEATILVSTHILSEAQHICDRVLILNKGLIVAEDTPHRLQSRLYGSESVVVKVRGNIHETLTLVASVPEILNVELKSDDSIEFTAAPGLELRPEITRILIQAGFDLLEIKSSTLSLEDIYLKLTRDDNPSPEVGNATNHKLQAGS